MTFRRFKRAESLSFTIDPSTLCLELNRDLIHDLLNISLQKILFIYEGQFLKETSSQWQKWFLVWETSWPWLLKGVLFTFLQGLGQRISNLTTTKREKGAKMKTVRLLAKALAAKEVEIAGERLADKSRQRLYWKERGKKKGTCILNFIYSIQYLLMCWADVNANAMLG